MINRKVSFVENVVCHSEAEPKNLKCSKTRFFTSLRCVQNDIFLLLADLQPASRFSDVERLILALPLGQHGVGQGEIGGGDRVVGFLVEAFIE